MRTHTSEFKEELKVFGRQIKGKITYYPSYDLVSESEDNILTEADLQIISEQANYDEPIEISEEDIFSINIIKNGDLLQSLMKEFDFETKIELNIGSVVNPQFGLLVNNEYEYLDYGNYIINSKEFNMDTETWSYVCYDKMLFSMVKYRGLSNIQYPITIKQFINKLCDKVGLEFEDSDFVNQGQLIYEDLYKNRDVTYRDIFDEISKIVAGNLLINDNDKLEVGYTNKASYSENATGSDISIEAVEEPILDVKLQGDTQQDGAPTPEAPIPIEIVTGEQNVEISNNIFKEYEIENVYFRANDTVFHGTTAARTVFIEIEPNTTYTVYRTSIIQNNFDVATSVNKPLHNGAITNVIENSTGNSITITSGENDKYLSIYCWWNSSTPLSDVVNTLKIAKSETYQSQNCLINLGNIELCKIGNYQDYIYNDNGNWYLHKETNKIKLNGTENWNYVSGNHPRFTTPKSDIALQNFNVGAPNVAISDYFKASNWYSVYSFASVDNAICSHNSAHVINIKSTQFTNLDDFKTWLSRNNTTVYYVMENSIDTQITDTTLIQQLDNLKNATLYSGTNNINVSGELPVILNLDYISEYESINEDYLKDTNVRMSEKIGVINSVAILDSDNNLQYIAEDTQSIKENQMTRVTITDNLIAMNGETQEIADNILNKLNGLYYYANDFQTTGVCYYDFLDMFNVEARGNVYQCLLLNNEITITQGIEEHIFTEKFEELETNKNEYTTSVISNKQVQFKINQQEGKIESKVEKDGVISAINQSAEEIQINANKLSFEGATINMTADNVKIKGENLDIDSNGTITLTDNSADEFQQRKIASYIVKSSYDSEYQGETAHVGYTHEVYANGRQNEYENDNNITGSSGYGHYFGGISENLYRYPSTTWYMKSDDYVAGYTEGTYNSMSVGVNSITSMQLSNGTYSYPLTITATGNITCVRLTQTSKEENKKNFEKLTNAKDILNQVDIYKYNFKNEDDNVKKSIGFVIGDDFNYSEEITSENNDGANIYSMVSVLWQVVKEQQEEINELKEMIKNGKY